ncbi:succinylglutamate desuccinylase/aspartoacylase family protein [Paraburkholderia kururiensis]|uniref:succinylglutamate desuccinylase/aspartoacylase family protein n=1 Tax=Paraburkholderia kururiensis TaxID=984307 RepID=UPI000A6654A1|nr:succinylglutamate desuccinylase/aspartoacylase family protein [Paraburkholderia kururiensis]
MHTRITPLLSPAIGTRRELVSFHFGSSSLGDGAKIYIQCSLHADETPAMLTGVMLRRRLAALEAQGVLAAEIVLVPVANPVGLAQNVLGQFVGRFELLSGKNFNRHFLDLAALTAGVEEALTSDAGRNVEIVREAVRAALAAQTPQTEFESLQLELLRLSFDADVVIDLHCSLEATMHLYTSDAGWEAFEPLARYLGARASLLATDSGGLAFDEAHSLFWWRLQQRAPAGRPVRAGTVATTVECRGQRDVTWETAQQDADAIVDFLMLRGAIRGEPKPLPALLADATPLAGSEPFYAPVSGILVHRVEPGAAVRAGDALFDIVDPITDETVTLTSRTDGILYMRRAVRFVTAGAPLGRVSGVRPIRSGVLLSA